jgi:hypothetical protein
MGSPGSGAVARRGDVPEPGARWAGPVHGPEEGLGRLYHIRPAPGPCDRGGGAGAGYS